MVLAKAQAILMGLDFTLELIWFNEEYRSKLGCIVSNIITLPRDRRVIFQFIIKEVNNGAHSITSNCLFSKVSETPNSLFLN